VSTAGARFFSDGTKAPENAAPEPRYDPHFDPGNVWSPFPDRINWELAHFLYVDAQMPLAKIDKLFTIWKASVMMYGGKLPFESSSDLLNYVDLIPYGKIPWQAREMTYPGVKPEVNAPPWMSETYPWYFKDPHDVLLHQLSNPEFAGHFDTAAYQEFKPNGSRRYKHFMSARFAWDQSVCSLG
jgi:hypothetical protein